MEPFQDSQGNNPSSSTSGPVKDQVTKGDPIRTLRCLEARLTRQPTRSTRVTPVRDQSMISTTFRGSQRSQLQVRSVDKRTIAMAMAISIRILATWEQRKVSRKKLHLSKTISSTSTLPPNRSLNRTFSISDQCRSKSRSKPSALSLAEVAHHSAISSRWVISPLTCLT